MCVRGSRMLAQAFRGGRLSGTSLEEVFRFSSSGYTPHMDCFSGRASLAELSGPNHLDSGADRRSTLQAQRVMSDTLSQPSRSIWHRRSIGLTLLLLLL